MRKKLTEKQNQILNFISRFTDNKNMSPTVYEIADFFKITTPTAFSHIKSLQSKGYVDRSSKARSLTLLRSSKPKHISFTLSIPILGRINAGVPLMAEEQIEETIKYDPQLLPKGIKNEHIFGLKVYGESMKDLGIFDGDTVIVKNDNSPRTSDIVVALIKENETTIKSFYVNADGIELRPANAEFKAQFYNFDEVTIQGIVIGLHRKF